MVECLWQGHNILGESPIWSPQNQTLYWLDILANELHSYDIITGQHQQWHFNEQACCLGLRYRGGLITALATRFAFIDLTSGELKPITDSILDSETTMFNDGHCDPLGRFWAGSKDSHESAPHGQLFCLDINHNIQSRAKGYTVANGLEWDPSDQWFYVADTPNKRIDRYKFDSHTGTISEPTTFVTLNDQEGYPDGLTVDSEGYVWNAHFMGGRVVRYTPEGHIDQVIDMPVTYPTSCCLGGAEGKTLFITSARRDLTPEQADNEPLAGSVFVANTEVSGVSPRYFYG